MHHRAFSFLTVALLWLGCTGDIAGSAEGTSGDRGPDTGGSGGARSSTPGARPGEPAGANGATGGPGAAPPAAPGAFIGSPGPSPRFYRLSHRQWENTVRALLRLPANAPTISSSFLAESVQGGFDNNGEVLQVAPPLWSDYQKAAESLAETVVRDPARLAAILPANLPTEPTARARAFIAGFGLRAYRRPLTDAEIESYLALFGQGPKLVAGGDPFKDGVQLAVALLLQSPHFLYRSELGAGTATAGKIALSEHEVASKLSYALTDNMPDDALFTAVSGRQLRTREAVIEQARRLLGSEAGAKTIERFHEQLLHMHEYETGTSGLGPMMKSETLSFTRDVLVTRDKGLGELLTSAYSYVNGKLAAIYGLAAPLNAQPDTAFVRADLDPTKRAGLLTQIGFLSSWSTIKRGAFVTNDLLCKTFQPPDNFSLPPRTGGMTNRQRIEATTEGEGTNCRACHRPFVNPPGFALESFDGTGKHRFMDGAFPVDTRTTFLLDGKERNLDGPVELSRAVAASQEAHDCYARRWAAYVLARAVDASQEADKALVAHLGGRSLQGGVSVKSLLVELVATDAFLTRAP